MTLSVWTRPISSVEDHLISPVQGQLIYPETLRASRPTEIQPGHLELPRRWFGERGFSFGPWKEFGW
jgi:hypothetical protein